MLSAYKYANKAGTFFYKFQSHILPTFLRMPELDECLIKRRVTEKYPQLYKKADDEILKIIESEMQALQKRSVDIAVTGRSGSGKSSFINMLLGLKAGMPQAAEVGVVETTIEPKAYPFPHRDNVQIWDLPGVGTQGFPLNSYVERVGLTRFSVLIIISSTRFSNEDEELFKVAKERNISALFVRTKVFGDIENMAKSHGSSTQAMEATVLKTIRDDIDKVLKGKPFYLIDNFECRKYDCNKLIRDLVLCNEDIKDVLVRCIDAKVGLMVDLKKTLLLEKCWWWGICMFFKGTNSSDTFKEKIELFINYLGLDDSSIESAFEEERATSIKTWKYHIQHLLLQDKRLKMIRDKIVPHHKIRECQYWAEDCVTRLAQLYSGNVDGIKKV